MTGYGAAEGDMAGRRVRVEIRTVNHRWFNLSTRLPSELSSLENELRDALRKDFERGHVNVSVRWVDEAAGVPGIDWVRAQAVVDALRELRERFTLEGPVTVEMVARQVDLFGSRQGAEPVAATWTDLAPAVAAATAECRVARQREGALLVEELRHRLSLLEAAAAVIEARVPERVVRERDRLKAHVGLLLDGRAVDETRVAQELAIAADRLDITEELIRFRVHIGAAREAVEGSAPIGKQLGFLAQELGREVNTMGSKANDPVIALEVVAMKGDLEKFREQLENLE